MSILQQIIDVKQQEIAAISLDIASTVTPTPCRSLVSKLDSTGLKCIAEVKKASPSKGLIYPDFNPIKLATMFESNGAACISVLTDVQFFKGAADYLTQVRASVTLPVLRKDFIIHPLQVYETKQMGADVMLLILDILTSEQANELMALAKELNIEVLVEVHSESAYKRLQDLTYVDIVGVNNRDLHTFTLDLGHALNFSKQLRQDMPDVKIVAESGYSKAEELKELEDNGIDGVLIGEGLSLYPSLLEFFK